MEFTKMKAKYLPILLLSCTLGLSGIASIVSDNKPEQRGFENTELLSENFDYIFNEFGIEYSRTPESSFKNGVVLNLSEIELEKLEETGLHNVYNGDISKIYKYNIKKEGFGDLSIALFNDENRERYYIDRVSFSYNTSNKNLNLEKFKIDSSEKTIKKTKEGYLRESQHYVFSKNADEEIEKTLTYDNNGIYIQELETIKAEEIKKRNDLLFDVLFLFPFITILIIKLPNRRLLRDLNKDDYSIKESYQWLLLKTKIKNIIYNLKTRNQKRKNTETLKEIISQEKIKTKEQKEEKIVKIENE
tara:strand:+ start:1305 stop:2213 length:909 start_codon:yes stop_codon:yes gene_type:complete